MFCLDECVVSFQVSTNGGLVSSMLCCGDLGMSVYLNFWVKNKFSSLLSGSKVLSGRGRWSSGTVMISSSVP